MFTQDKINEYLASGKHAITFIAGAGTAFGIQQVAGLSPTEIQTSFDHIVTGLKEISIGAGPLLAAGMAWWAKNRAKLSTQVANVKAAEPQALVQAVQEVSPVMLRDAVAAQPEVKTVVVTSSILANASPSAKVVSSV